MTIDYPAQRWDDALYRAALKRYIRRHVGPIVRDAPTRDLEQRAGKAGINEARAAVQDERWRRMERVSSP